MRYSSLVFATVALSSSVSAQFDYGFSAGGVLNELHVKDIDDPHVSASISNVGWTALSASVFYRERYSDFVDLGFDITLAHRSFGITYASGGLGGGTARSAHVEIDQLYFGVKPEVRMDAKRSAVVRFGFIAGFRTGGSAKGTSSHYGGYGSQYDNDVDLIRDFGGDLRFAFGFGFRAPVGARWAVTVDPEATIALSSMLKLSALTRGSDFGLRIGLSHRSNGKALTQLFKNDRAKRNDIW